MYLATGMKLFVKLVLKQGVTDTAYAASSNVPQRRKQIRLGSVLDHGVVALLRNGETESLHGNSLIETYQGAFPGTRIAT